MDDRKAPLGPRLVGWSLWLLLIAVEATLAATIRAYQAVPGMPQDTASLATFTDTLTIFTTVAGSVGLFLRLRRAANLVATLLAAGPILIVGGFLGYSLAYLSMRTDMVDDALGGLGIAVASAILVPGILALLPGVAIVFPDGRLAGPRFRLPVRAVLALAAVGSIVGLFTDHPSGDPANPVPANPIALPFLPPEAADAASAATSIALLLAFALAVASVVVRFRRARGIERQQLKWFLAAVVVNAVLLPLSFLTDVGPADAIDLASVLGATLMPLAIGVAILRYRLYDIDTIINRAIVYGAMTAMLAGLMSAAIAVTRSVFEGLIGSGTEWSVIVSTVVVVSAFEPLKKRVQTFVDGRWKPAEDPVAELRAHGERVRRFLGPLDAGRTMRETLTVAVSAYRAHRGRVTWTLGPDAGEATEGAAEGEEVAGEDLVATAAVAGASARLTLLGVAEPGIGEAELEAALAAVLGELTRSSR